MNLDCLFFHNWEKWKTSKDANIVRGDDEKAVVGRLIQQERVCKKCNKIELRLEQITL